MSNRAYEILASLSYKKLKFQQYTYVLNSWLSRLYCSCRPISRTFSFTNCAKQRKQLLTFTSENSTILLCNIFKISPNNSRNFTNFLKSSYHFHEMFSNFPIISLRFSKFLHNYPDFLQIILKILKNNFFCVHMGILFSCFRSILLKNCFSINRRTDTKHKQVVGLFSGTDCFGIVFECEEDLQEWLRQLLLHQQGDDVTDGASPKPYFGMLIFIYIYIYIFANYQVQG